MGLTKKSYLALIEIPVTITNPKKLKGGKIEHIQEKCLFKLRRETNADTNGLAMASAVGAKVPFDLLFVRFCHLLAEPPVGFDDFPTDDRPMEERAREYFAEPEYLIIVRLVMAFYNRILFPAELFQ